MAREDEETWLAVIGKALALMALHRAELGNSGVGEQAYFLESLGIPRDDVAAMLKTSPESIGVLVNRIKRGGRRGKSKKK